LKIPEKHRGPRVWDLWFKLSKTYRHTCLPHAYANA